MFYIYTFIIYLYILVKYIHAQFIIIIFYYLQKKKCFCVSKMFLVRVFITSR